MAAEIRLEGVTKSFGGIIAVKEMNLTVNKGEFLVLLGPSGCGKTTVLRCIAGLERVDKGRIYISGRDVTDFPPAKRAISMVFQSYAVFPHMTVAQNIGFGLRMRHIPKMEIERAVKEVAELLKIDDLLNRYPAQLSGGQRQRVAVARAIVTRPAVLLMDEPLSNLDALLRLRMRAELKRLHHEIGTTIIYVTHDQIEALSLGDRIAVMLNGEIVQVNTPTQIYDRPADRFVGGFIGTPPMNFLKATVAADGLMIRGFPITVPEEWGKGLKGMIGKVVLLGIRAENIMVHPEPKKGELTAEVIVSEPMGSQQLLTLQVGDDVLKVTTRPDLRIQPKQVIGLSLTKDKIRLFDKETGKALMFD
ncbi:sugar ABC transporter ATP-binding protein [candidate division WOR-3 bacterium]|uniref:Sugar ABC transporter ATP-binding protein n=1 Tax=candidate division WOR-3 bacterium TaxID=2052148 RepID=A0A660SIF1_UNCW3|nr:MAG: sugar ABC transporter ATP-binding protein [candidate division WOR-3 bacterium]